MELEQTQQQTYQVESLPTDLGSCVAGLVNSLAKGTTDLTAPPRSHTLGLRRAQTLPGKGRVDDLSAGAGAAGQRLSHKPRGDQTGDMSLMRRRRPRNDRRVVFLTLTDDGKALTLDLQRRVHSYEAVISEGVSDEEMAVFASVTSRVMVNYAARRRSGPLSCDSQGSAS